MTAPKVTAATKALVWKRAKGACERCGATISGDYSIHHRRVKGMGGSKDPDTNSAANLVLVCGSGVSLCHGIIHAQPTTSLEEGWLVRQGQDPSKVPVQRLGELVRLDRDGCVSAA